MQLAILSNMAQLLLYYRHGMAEYHGNKAAGPGLPGAGRKVPRAGTIHLGKRCYRPYSGLLTGWVAFFVMLINNLP